MDAALGEFRRKGFRDTSVADIMRAADLGIGTFYNYFNSKVICMGNFIIV